MVENWSRCSGRIRPETEYLCTQVTAEREGEGIMVGSGGCSVRAGDKRTKGPTGSLGNRITPKDVARVV